MYNGMTNQHVTFQTKIIRKEQANELTVFSLELWLALLVLRRGRVLCLGAALLWLNLCQVDLVLTEPGGCDAAGHLVDGDRHTSLHLGHPNFWIREIVGITPHTT